VQERKVLRKIFRPKKDEMDNLGYCITRSFVIDAGHYYYYYYYYHHHHHPIIVRTVKPRRLQRAGHVASMGR
jgi:hypothetical protein